jgi:hypothetical protein
MPTITASQNLRTQSRDWQTSHMLLLHTGLTCVMSLAIIFAGSTALATQPSTGKDNAQAPLFTACHSSLADLDKNLKLMEQKTIKWAHTKTAKELSSPQLGDTTNGRQVMLFSANLLPKGFAFLALDRQCWTRYVDFERAVARNDQAATRTTLSKWTNCLPISFGETPPEALELVDCVSTLPVLKTK